ncbi:hypothetical protein [Algihabitans albus]|uniref:hypothetical protein n=1 Tax=Algihabitans albus TaxID=2164067 RepID=UPI000E5CB6DB|nr:hypothetical protein [Algihabitans albus]
MTIRFGPAADGSGKRRRFTGCFVAALCLLLLAQPGNTVQAATPITGVSCGGGFFVKIRSHEVFWIQTEEEKRTSVYNGGSPIFAMAQCGTGVLTVFGTGDQETRNYDIYHSPDCRKIGEAGGNTTLVHSSPLQVTRITPEESGVSLRFSDGSVVRSDICSLPGR